MEHPIIKRGHGTGYRFTATMTLNIAHLPGVNVIPMKLGEEIEPGYFRTSYNTVKSGKYDFLHEEFSSCSQAVHDTRWLADMIAVRLDHCGSSIMIDRPIAMEIWKALLRRE